MRKLANLLENYKMSLFSASCCHILITLASIFQANKPQLLPKLRSVLITFVLYQVKHSYKNIQVD